MTFMVNVTTSVIGVTDVARALGVHRNTVYRWVDDGTLAPVDRLPGPTGALLFDRAEVEALAQRRAQAAERAGAGA